MVGDAADPRFKPLIILQLISPTTSNFDPGEVVPMPTFPSMSITNLLLFVPCNSLYCPISLLYVPTF